MNNNVTIAWLLIHDFNLSMKTKSKKSLVSSLSLLTHVTKIVGKNTNLAESYSKISKTWC